MRVDITLNSSEGLRLPRQYNELLQGFLYRHLEAELARRLHDEGFMDPESRRRLRFFTFSRLMGRWRPDGEGIFFRGPVRWLVASPWEELLSSLVEHLLQSRELKIGTQSIHVENIEVEPPLEPRRPITVQALSPVTIYSTLYTAEGKRKTYYYSPFEAEFEELLLKNLARKARTWYGKDVEAEGHIRPVKVSPRDEHIVKYKGTVIKAWTGVYELDLPPELFRMAFDAGLGAKNSQGFGCLAVWNPPG
jgi:CRISPR-associated endoribonuclease Cas6